MKVPVTKNSVLFRCLCRRICEARLSNKDANLAVLLRLLLMTQVDPFAVQVEPVIFAEMSPI